MDALMLAEASARALGHPVALVLAEPGRDLVVCSLGGEPERMRVAWLDPTGTNVLGRVGCPPLRASRSRPVVSCVVAWHAQEGPPDRVLVAQVAPGVTAIRPILAVEEPPEDLPVGAEGLVATRLPPEAVLIAVDAVDGLGEPVGRLVGAGVADLRLEAGAVGGRLGTSHGMAAGFGGGRWVEGLEQAEFGAGFTPRLPEWVPEGFVVGRPRLEPDVSYPAAPPAIVIAWTGPGDARILLRQAPAPLASPDPGGGSSRLVDVNGSEGVLRGRWMPTLVWETGDRAFGLQLRQVDDGEETVLRIARSIPTADV